METLRAGIAFSALVSGVLFYFGRGTIDLGGVSFLEISGNHWAAAVLALIGLSIAVQRG